MSLDEQRALYQSIWNQVMPIVNVRSTAISTIDYDDQSRTLNVTFISGRTYTHENVPPEVFDQFAASSSPGRFYMDEIKGVY